MDLRGRWTPEFVHAFLSGVLSKNSRGLTEKNITVDQKAAAHVGAATRYPSMQITSGSGGGSILSWNSAGVAIPPIRDLHLLFSMLFRPTPKGDLSMLRKLNKQNISINLILFSLMLIFCTKE